MVALRLRHSPHGLNIRSLNRQSWKDKLMSLFNHWLIYKHPLISKGCQLNSVIIVDKPSDHVSPFGSWLFLCSAWTRQTHLGGSTTQRLICRSRPLCSLEFQAAEEMVYQSRNLGLIISDQPIMLSYLFLFHISYINHIYIYISYHYHILILNYIYIYMISEGKASSPYMFTDSSRGVPGERRPGHHSRGLGPGATGFPSTTPAGSDGFPAARSSYWNMIGTWWKICWKHHIYNTI